MQDIKINGSAQVNASGGIRVNESRGLVECKMLHDIRIGMHNDLVSGAGSSITYLPNESAVLMTCGTGATDRVVRQSARPMCYVAGNPTEGILTGYLGPQKENNYSRIGVGNDRDGIFFERNFTDVRLVIRSNTSGTPSDTNYYVVGDDVPPAGWEIFTTLPGIDWTKVQYFYIDFLWQGVGTVRFGVWIKGQFILIAQYTGANLLTTPYMANPSLPAFYEIGNTGVTASSSSMKEICWVLKTGGGSHLQGVDYTVGSGTTLTNVKTRRPILAIRMAANFNGKINNRIAQLAHMDAYAQSNSAYFEIIHCDPDFTSTDGAWVAAANDSAVEVNKTITTVTGGTQHIVGDLFLPSGVGAGSVAEQEFLDPVGEHSWLSNNIDNTKSRMFILFATSFNVAVGSDVSASFSFHEVE